MKFDYADIDPPWPFDTWSEKGNNIAGVHYDLMTAEDIKALPINALLADHALVGLWSTFPQMPLALECGKAWGLTYVTCLFLQIKHYVGKKSQNSWFLGNGKYTRANAEPCFIFKKGDGLGLPADHSIKQIVGDLPLSFRMEDLFPELLLTAYQRHSRKVIDCYEGIERMYPAARKIRLFARDERPGWVSLGNEVTGNDIRVDLEAIIGYTSGIQ